MVGMFSKTPKDELSGELEVYTRKVFKGKWTSVQASLRDCRLMYGEKQVILTSETRIEKKAFGKDRSHVFELSRFNGSKKTKRLFDCKTVAGLEEWFKQIERAIAHGPGSVESAFVQKDTTTSESSHWQRHASMAVLRVRDNENDFFSSDKIQISTWRVSRRARLRFVRAIRRVLEEKAEARRRERGYTALELASLKAELAELRRECGRALRYKVRRVLRALRDQQPKLRGVAALQAQEHGLLIGEKHNSTIIPIQTAGQAHVGIGSSSFLPPPPQDVASILARLPELLRRNRVLANLAKTLQVLAAKSAQSALSTLDAATCLLAGTVFEALLNLPGGLSILLSLPAERFAFKKLCVAALLCRVPLFTTRILELLAALAVLPETHHQVEALRLVRSVFRELDKRTQWGQPACLRTPLFASSTVVDEQHPPSFASIAQIILDHDSAFDLRTAAIQALTAICAAVHRAQGREHALWTQVQIFYALRRVAASIPINTSEKSAVTTDEHGRRRRASTTNVRRKSDTDGKKNQNTQADEGSLCPPLVALLEYAENNDVMLRIAVERFLDSWDARELDEAELLASLDDAPGSAARCAILASRIRRSALLLAHADVDELLHKLGEELEVAAAQPATLKDQQEIRSPHIDVHATAAALHRLQPRGSIHSPSLGPAKRPLSARSPVMTKPQKADHVMTATKVKDDPKYAKYFKMLRLHIPAMAVANKMSAEGLDPTILDLDPDQPLPAELISRASEDAKSREQRLAPEVALKDHPVYAKYFRMLKMHIPRQAVENKMNAEGLDPKILDNDAEGPLPSVASAPEPAASTTLLKDDKVYGKYIKQLRMHVPRIAVEAKMAAEGLDPEILNLDFEKPLPTKFSSKSSTAMKAPAEKTSAPPRHCARPPEVKVRKVFLDLITDGSGTFYDDMKAKDVLMHETAIKDLERVFHVPARRSTLASEDAAAAAQAAANDMAQMQAESARGKGQLESIVAEALGPKRTFALSLMFGSLKISTSRVVEMLTKLDKGNDLAQLGILYNMLADASEVTAVDHACSSISDGKDRKFDEVSQFFLQLHKVPRKRSKIIILWLAATVEDRVYELESTIQAHVSAATAVRSSPGLKSILRLALAISNFTNSGTARANVAGVKLLSLLKLRNTKTTTNSSGGTSASSEGEASNQPHIKNLLAFVVKHVDIEADALRAELPSDTLAASYLTTQRNEIRILINQLAAELDVAKAERESLKGASQQTEAQVNADNICSHAEEAIAKIRADFEAMENQIDEMLTHYGETLTADFEELLRTIDRFVVFFEDEARELAEADARRKRREQLLLNQQEREKAIGALHTSNKLQRDASSNPTKISPTGGALRAALKRVASGRALECDNRNAPTIKNFAHDKISQIRGAHRPQDEFDDEDDDDSDFE